MDMNGHERRFVVAAVLAHRLGVRLDLSDEALTEEYAKAMATMLAAESGDAKASIAMVRAQEWIAGAVSAIEEGRRDKTVN